MNFIKSQVLSNRQFQEFLKSLDSEYSDITYYSEVVWLSQTQMLKRVYDLKKEIKLFFESNLKSVPDYENQHCFCDFAFLVDMTGRLNEVNKRLQPINSSEGSTDKQNV